MAEEQAQPPGRDELIASIITAAAERTKAGTLAWSHATYRETFKTKVKDLNVTVSQLSSQNSLTIADAGHDTIAQIHEDATSTGRPLDALYHLARASAKRGTEKLQQLLEDLENPQSEPPPQPRKKNLLARLGLTGRRN